MPPALNVIGMRDGAEAAFGAGYNVLPIWQERLETKTLVTTPNSDVLYAGRFGRCLWLPTQVSIRMA
jgi:hypothetical protein